MTEVRDLFNAKRDHESSAEDLIAAIDTASYAAGYELAEFVGWMEAAISSLQERLTQVKDEID